MTKLINNKKGGGGGSSNWGLLLIVVGFVLFFAVAIPYFTSPFTGKSSVNEQSQNATEQGKIFVGYEGIVSGGVSSGTCGVLCLLFGGEKDNSSLTSQNLGILGSGQNFITSSLSFWSQIDPIITVPLLILVSLGFVVGIIKAFTPVA